jgi:hypothetical protein
MPSLASLAPAFPAGTKGRAILAGSGYGLR